MARRKRAPVTDRTYRFGPGPVNYVEELFGLIGDENVVVWMPKDAEWKRGLLLGLVPSRDIFRIKWTEDGYGQNQRGIWRVHSASLFTRSGLPVPLYSARLPQSTTTHQKGAPVATTRRKTTATKAAPAKKAAKKTAAKAEPAENGASTRKDKLGGLSEAKKRNIAKLIYRERSKSPATGWDDIAELIQEKYDWELPGSMTGRRLLREYGPEDAESAIIQQDKSASTTTTKKKTTKKKAVVEEEEDEDELEEEDEDEEDLEDEADEDEDEEEEEPAPKRSRAKKVAVRGRGKRANPSK